MTKEQLVQEAIHARKIHFHPTQSLVLVQRY